MRRFLIALAVYAAALSFGGAALYPPDAEAGKTVMIYCAPKSKIVRYPHFNGTRVRCSAPRFWLRVPYKFAIRIGAYPILLARANNACVGGKPKVVRTPGASSWRLVGQRCVKQGIG